MLDTLNFKDKNYNIRVLNTEEYGTVKIATNTLSDALMTDDTEEAEYVDSSIFFYVEEDEIDLPEEELISLIEESI
jgi:hypothetical protein